MRSPPVWMLVLFDLPSVDAGSRRAYARFRKSLLGWGFEALQESAYGRWEETAEAGNRLRRRVLAAAPGEGCVAVLALPDRVWEGMDVRVDGKPGAAPAKPGGFLVWP